MAQAVRDSWFQPTSEGPKSVQACWSETLCFWPQFNFLVSYEFVLGMHALYAIGIYTLRRWMQHREPYELKHALLVYNFAQIVFSTLMTAGLSKYVLNGFYNLNGTADANMEFWILMHALAKYLDMMDTVFIVLRKKDRQLSVLHVYHHLSIGVLWSGLLHWGLASGTCFFGAWINSLVHAVMYSHYFFTSPSLGFTNPWKAYLTKFQMFQFFLCVVHSILAVVVDKEYPQKVAVVQMLYHPTLLYLFYDFLTSEAFENKKIKDAAAAKKAGVANKQIEGSTSVERTETPKKRTSSATKKK